MPLVLLNKPHTVLASPLFQPIQVSLQDRCHFSHVHLTTQFSVISKLGEGAFNLALFVLSCFTRPTCLTTKQKPQSWQEGDSSDIWAGISATESQAKPQVLVTVSLSHCLEMHSASWALKSKECCDTEAFLWLWLEVPCQKKEVVSHGEELYESVLEHTSCGITDCKQ